MFNYLKMMTTKGARHRFAVFSYGFKQYNNYASNVACSANRMGSGMERPRPLARSPKQTKSLVRSHNNYQQRRYTADYLSADQQASENQVLIQ